MEDSFIIKELREKNEIGIEAFIRKYGNLVKGVLNKLLSNYDRSEIDGIFYDVIYKIWNNIECYDEEKGKFINFVISVSRYTAIDYLRKEKFKPTLEIREEILEDNSYEDRYELDSDKESFEELLKGLKDIDRDIFLRKYYLEQDVSSIAKDLKVKEDYIYTRLSRGRRKLKEMLWGEAYE